MNHAVSAGYSESGYWGAAITSVALHAAILLGLSFNFDLFKRDDSIFRAKVIDAVVVDSSVLDALDQKKRKQENLKKQQQAAEAKRKQEAERIKQEKLEQQRLAEQKKQEEQIRLAKQKKLEEEKRLAEQKRLEEEKRLAEQKRLQEQARQEEQRRLQQAQQKEWDKLQAEEKAAAEQARSRELANSMDLYKQAIKQRVDRNWVRPLSAEDWYSCEVVVDQIPGGEVVNVAIQKCDGDAVFQRSVRNAVYKSSPLPDPPNPALFDRRIQFTFKVPTT